MSDYSSTPILDAAPLEELIDIMEDEIGDLVDAYLEDAPSLLADINSAFENNDLDKLVRAAHSLKSSSANMGIMRLSTIAKDIEETGRGGDMEACKPLADQASSIWPESETALKAALPA